MLAAEAATKCFGVRLLGKAEHAPPFALVADRVSARAERQAETEGVHRSVVRFAALLGAQRHRTGSGPRSCCEGRWCCSYPFCTLGIVLTHAWPVETAVCLFPARST